MSYTLSKSFFFLSTFISSFGSLLFVISVPTFFIQSGFSVELIGIAIGIHRFAGLSATAWIGTQIDKYNSKKVVIYTEMVGVVCSVGLIFTWLNRESIGLIPFLFCMGSRSFAMGVQNSSRNRLIKLLSLDNQNAETHMAIWLNKVTQGAHVISALTAIPLAVSGNFIAAIAIDGISFLINGFSTILLPDLDNTEKRNLPNYNFTKAMMKLISLHKMTYIQDLLLALVVSGTLILIVKLSGGNSTHVIFFNLLFGSCIWIGSLFAYKLVLRNKNILYWVLILAGFISLSASYQSNWKFGSFLIVYLGYWILFHKYTVEIQTKTPTETIGAVMAARHLSVTFVLSVGELLGGYVSRLITLKEEIIIRACICVIVIFYLFILKMKKNKIL